jgi:hypothetical protein
MVIVAFFTDGALTATRCYVDALDASSRESIAFGNLFAKLPHRLDLSGRSSVSLIFKSTIP